MMHFLSLTNTVILHFNRVLSANVLTFVIVGYSVHCLATDAKFTFGILWNFGTFLGILEHFREFWKVSGNFGTFLGILEHFREFWNVSGNFGKLLGILETYREL